MWLNFKHLIATACVVAIIQTVHAQSDTTREMLPDQTSFYNSELPGDLEPKKDFVSLTFAQLPDRIMNAIESRREYRGWQNGKIYYDKVNQVYKLYVPEGSSEKIFGIDMQGHAITFTEKKQ